MGHHFILFFCVVLLLILLLKTTQTNVALTPKTLCLFVFYFSLIHHGSHFSLGPEMSQVDTGDNVE